MLVTKDSLQANSVPNTTAKQVFHFFYLFIKIVCQPEVVVISLSTDYWQDTVLY